MTQRTRLITLGSERFRPLPTFDTATYVRAYTELNWLVVPGHRYRPRAGCTCRDGVADAPDCPAPGAHPLTDSVVGAPARTAEDFAAPGVAVIAATQPFDAAVLPRQIGMAVMVGLDRRGPVPCFTTRTHAVILVRPGTGCVLSAPSYGVSVLSGASHWVALPPSHDVRWDTPPWDESTGVPLPLEHGHAIKPEIFRVLRMGSER